MAFDDLKHAQQERLIFLDRCLTWRGAANRRDLIVRFGISAPQAALDFKLYIDRATRPPVYDPARKTYLAARDHEPVASSGLAEVFDTITNPEDGASAALPKPDRHAEPAIVSRLFQALRARQAIHVRYTSMTSGADGGQWIAPTRFTTDGESIHVRAFSFKHEEYRSYLPVRIDSASTFNVRELAAALPRDEDWNTLARIWLQPRSGLTSEQAAAVRREYGFAGRFLKLEIRKALEFYFDRRWSIGMPGGRLQRHKTEYAPIALSSGASRTGADRERER